MHLKADSTPVQTMSFCLSWLINVTALYAFFLSKSPGLERTQNSRLVRNSTTGTSRKAAMALSTWFCCFRIHFLFCGDFLRLQNTYRDCDETNQPLVWALMTLVPPNPCSGNRSCKCQRRNPPRVFVPLPGAGPVDRGRSHSCPMVISLLTGKAWKFFRNFQLCLSKRLFWKR